MAISSAAAPCNPAALAPSLRICFWAEATALAKRASSSPTWSSSMVYSGTLTAPDSTRWAMPTAMPEETPTPSKVCSLVLRRRLRSIFIELAPYQIEDGKQGLLRIAPADRYLDLVAEAGGQHHQAHDRTAIGNEFTTTHLDVGLEVVRQFYELGGRAGVQAALVADG